MKFLHRLFEIWNFRRRTNVFIVENIRVIFLFLNSIRFVFKESIRFVLNGGRRFDPHNCDRENLKSLDTKMDPRTRLGGSMGRVLRMKKNKIRFLWC
jgi:hypothetical protein